MSETTQVRLELLKVLLIAEGNQIAFRREVVPAEPPPAERYAALEAEVDRLAAIVVRPGVFSPSPS